MMRKRFSWLIPKSIFAKFLISCLVLGLFLFLVLDRQIELTRLRLQVPQVARELREIQEENTHLQYLIDQFESPENLLQLARRPEFSHLKYPTQDEIVEIK